MLPWQSMNAATNTLTDINILVGLLPNVTFLTPILHSFSTGRQLGNTALETMMTSGGRRPAFLTTGWVVITLVQLDSTGKTVTLKNNKCNI